MTTNDQIYVLAKKYICDQHIAYNVNVLSSVCQLLHSEKNRNIIYNELITIHDQINTNLILSTLSIIKNDKPIDLEEIKKYYEII